MAPGSKPPEPPEFRPATPTGVAWEVARLGELTGERVPPLTAVKRLLIGRPMSAEQMGETLLSKTLALPIFASDALSSVAYATEAALLVLLAASATARGTVVPISIAISVLLVVVAASYRQTVRAYQGNGGAYVVARENLGVMASLVAAAALLIDYVLTVAVSISGGIDALRSLAPSINHLRLELALGLLALLVIANLRGLREAGLLFALPTYGFVLSVLAVLGAGAARCTIDGCPHAYQPQPVKSGMGALGVFIVLKAFAKGSSALTGVEAIANGVNAFRPPQARNAARTLVVMAGIAVVLFMGLSLLSSGMHATPTPEGGSGPTVLAQVAKAAFSPTNAETVPFWIVQIFTVAILVLAANTSFQGFPRLASIMARDRVFPTQFSNMGDRLVNSNGILVLAVLAAAIIVAFDADTQRIVDLYVVGVFIAFTLSQTGMALHWRRERAPGWRRRATLNGFGATLTALVAVVATVTKFFEGMYAVLIGVILIVLACYGIRRHYRRVRRRLEAAAPSIAAAGPGHNEVVVYVERMDDATRRAISYAQAISSGPMRGVHIPFRRQREDLGGEWAKAAGESPLIELPLVDNRAETVLEHVWAVHRDERHFVTVVIPEQFERRSWTMELRQGTELSLKLQLQREPGVATADVPYLASDEAGQPPTRVVSRVLVSGGGAATARAVNYARALGIDDVKALSFPFDRDERAELERGWKAAEDFPLQVIEAPYRDLGAPLLAYIRMLKADPEVLVSIVMPEVIFGGWRRALHNQRAFHIRRLLLFEPRVVLTSIPYQML